MTILALAAALLRLGHPSVTPADLARARILAATITRAAEAHDIDAVLLAALCAHESPGFVKRVGKFGEQGYCQLLPATARLLGFRGSDAALAQDPLNFGYAAEWLARMRATCAKHGHRKNLDAAALNAYRGASCSTRNGRPSRYARLILEAVTWARYLEDAPPPAAVRAYWRAIGAEGEAREVLATTTKPTGARRRAKGRA